MTFRGVAAVAVLSAVSLGCRKSPAAAPAPPPAPVTVSQPIAREITDVRDFTGRIEAVESVEIRARVRGFLQKIQFKEGSEVKKGDALFDIDPRTFEADLAKAKADVTRQEAQVRLTTAEVDRVSRARATGAVAEEEYQQRVAARDVAKATLLQVQAAARSAELELGFTKITAPIDGRVGRALVTEGNLVGSPDPTLLTTIVRLNPAYVYFEGTEKGLLEYEKLVREQGYQSATQGKIPVSVGLTAEQGHPHPGVIDFRDNRVDPGTGTILLRAVLPNPDRVLTPGLFARVRVPIGKPRQRLLVPELALQTDQRGRSVLVVRADHTVEQRVVVPGAGQEGGLIVIESGLTADDWVVVNGLQRARPGSKVEPQKAVASPPVAKAAPKQ